MGGHRDASPRRLILLGGGTVFCVAVSEFAGAGVVSALAASATDGAVGTLVDEMMEFLIGVVVAAAVLALIRIVTGGCRE